jgi:hypothetical protein
MNEQGPRLWYPDHQIPRLQLRDCLYILSGMYQDTEGVATCLAFEEEGFHNKNKPHEAIEMVSVQMKGLFLCLKVYIQYEGIASELWTALVHGSSSRVRSRNPW